MANTPNLDLENINVLLDTDSAYNQLVTEIIPKINSNNLKIDGLPNNFIPSSQKGVANGIATLGSDGIIPKGQLPIDSGSVQRVTDIIARDAITNLYDNKLVFVTDASADTTVTAGWAMYIYSTASLSWTKIVDAESLDLQLTWDNITNKPTAFPPDTHTHEQIQTNADNITNLQNNKVDKITGSRLVSETEITVFNDKYSKVEVDNKLSALETKIDWKEAVNTYADIATTYPTPIDGWTVNVKDTDYTYRYNGIEWIPISANVIPKATTSVDGLMSKEDKAQVEQNKTDILSAKTTLGSVAMTTTAQTVTGAINELDADIGNKSTLATTDKSNLVNAVNETKTLINTLDADVVAHKAESAYKHIKESGSNENGYYIKFDDGTQICYKDFDGELGVSDIPNTVWTFPASFTVDARRIAGYTSGALILSDTGAMLFAIRPTETMFAAIDGISARVSVKVSTVEANRKVSYRSFAIGRWK